MEIKHMKQLQQLLNEDSGSEGIVELNDRLEEPNIVDNNTDSHGKKQGQESQQSFQFKQDQNNRQEVNIK